MTGAGADGCRRGWVVATRSGVEVVTALADIADRHTVIGVDMPVVLADAWGRRCDDEARRFLGRRASTIFNAPPRSIVDHVDYAVCNAEARRRYGRAFSRQSFNLFPKIREMLALAADRPGLLLEIHPECSFRTLAGRDLAPKRTAAGFADRLALVRSVFGAVETRVPGAARDDVLDAYAVLWSVERYERGVHRVLGEAPMTIIV